MPAIPELTDLLCNGRVGLRLAAERDIPEVLIAHQDDPGLAAAVGLERPPSGAQLGRALEDAPGRREAGADVTLTIVEADTDECRGQVTADRFDWEHGHADLAIWVAPHARRRGLGRGALSLAAEWLLDAGGLVRVQLLCPPGNEAVIRAALAAGFAHEGVLRARQRERGGTRGDRTVLSRIASHPAAP